MQRLLEVITKVQANDIKLRNRRLPLSEYNTTVNIMQAVVAVAAVVGLVREPMIIIKHVL